MSKIKHIIFICTGNTCRSPMAEGIARKLFADYGLSITVDSFGTLQMGGNPPSPEAISLCIKHDIDISQHKAQQLTLEAAQKADLILTMERKHIYWIEDFFGEHIAQKAQLLTEYLSEKPFGDEIPDPIGEGRMIYEEVFEMLWKEIERIVRIV